MMRISRGTYYSGSWSSTAFIFQISLHPRFGLNPSSPGAGRPAHQPRAPGITVHLAWLGLYIDFTHKLTINPLSLYKRLKELRKGGREDPKNPFFLQRRKDQTIALLLHQLELKQCSIHCSLPVTIYQCSNPWYNMVQICIGNLCTSHVLNTVKIIYCVHCQKITIRVENSQLLTQVQVMCTGFRSNRYNYQSITVCCTSNS